MKNFKSKHILAYTLSELIVVMLIISVIVGVTIKITTTKLHKILSINYYSAVSTLRSVNTQMLKDFDAEDEKYLAAKNKIKEFWLSFTGFFNPAYGTAYHCPATCQMVLCTTASEFIEGGIDGCCKGCSDDNSSSGTLCANGEEAPYCRPDQAVNLTTCSCDSTSSNLGELDNSGNVCPDVIPCGQECNEATGTLQAISGFSRTCPSSKEQWSETACGCIPIVRTLPRKGANYCELFNNYANTSPSLISQFAHGVCSGSAISNGTTDFSGKIEDIVLSNGMLIYNASQNPARIVRLIGNASGSTYEQNGVTIDIDEWGYTLYIDIDGRNNGDGKLWEDVYPFYVTLSGKVIPAYDTANPETAGGDSRSHLQTSVSDEYSANGRLNLDWITKSTSFKESACKMGYIKPATPYCTGFAKVNACDEVGHDCNLKYIVPIKLF